MASALKNKKTVIFGASSGIGAAVARRFAALGSEVIVHYNGNQAGAEQVVRDILDKGGKAHLLAGDVSQAEVAERLVNEAAAKLGRLDVVINNAGNMFGRTAIAKATDQQYHDVDRSQYRRRILRVPSGCGHPSGSEIRHHHQHHLSCRAHRRRRWCGALWCCKGLCQHHHARAWPRNWRPMVCV